MGAREWSVSVSVIIYRWVSLEREGNKVGVHTYTYTDTDTYTYTYTAQVCCKGLTSFEFEVYVRRQHKSLEENSIRHKDRTLPSREAWTVLKRISQRGVFHSISVFLPAKEAKDHGIIVLAIVVRCSEGGITFPRSNWLSEAFKPLATNKKNMCAYSGGGVEHSLIRTQAYIRTRKEPGDRNDTDLNSNKVQQLEFAGSSS